MSHRITLVLALGLLVSLCIGTVAYAQEATPPATDGALLIEPSRLTIATDGGCPPTFIPGSTPCTQIHQLTLRATRVITNVTAITTDLRRADAQAIFPANAIHPTFIRTELMTDTVVTLTLALDMAAAPAGEYTGDLLLVYPGGVRSLPLTVRLRHWWLPPLGLLVAVLLVGLAFAQYRDQQRPRDSLIVQVGYLVDQMSRDTMLITAFQHPLDRQIAASRQALQFGHPADAQTALSATQELWGRWRAYRDDWITLDTHRTQLLHALDTPPAVASGVFRDSLEQALVQIERSLGMSAQPTTVQDDLAKVRTALEAFRTSAAKISALLRQIDTLDNAAVAQLRTSVQERRQQLSLLTMENTDGMAQLITLLANDAHEVQNAMLAHSDNGMNQVLGTSSGGPEGAASPLPPSQLPELGTLFGATISDNPTADAARARRRILIFGITSLIITAVGLVPLGFNQLYVTNPIFGANPWLDYPALIFWALGIEGSRETILGMLSG
ncbi:hypothetical protein K2Z83_22975 [Oscillochloris sp. ZM17-4]|uniref:hypothetical protein n=1 Tax=Oscillochloris sp. ZM17-4 TaxID=2866714 RepID=UPI001C73482D|nr:hypothetical protein [Oscillochloris sp. ZM17-4]MBX0330523.1 hypothetical protein [Oscillochloris sp. ZM17-4]